MRFDAGRQTVQCSHSIVEAVGVVLGNLHRFQLLQACFLGNLILALVGIVLQMPYVRYIAHVAHLVANVLQVTEKDIESDSRTGMT